MSNRFIPLPNAIGQHDPNASTFEPLITDNLNNLAIVEMESATRSKLALWQVVLAFAAIGLVAQIFRYATHVSRRWKSAQQVMIKHNCQPPPKQYPWDVTSIATTIVSNYHLIKGTLIPNMSNLFRQYGPTYKTVVIGQPLLITKDPANIRHVLVTRFDDFNTAEKLRTTLFHPLTGGGIFGLDGHEWKSTRPMYRDLFSRTRLVFDCEMHEELFQDLLACFPKDSSEFDLQTLLPKLLIDFSTEWTVGDRNNALKNRQSPNGTLLANALTDAKTFMAKFARMGPVAILFLSRKQFFRDCKTVRSVLDQYVAEALKANTKAVEQGITAVQAQEQAGNKASLLHRLMEYTTDAELLRDTVASMMVATTESVGSVLAATFWLLARDPVAYAKLREDIFETIGSEVPTFDQLRQMKYLRWVQNEAMRILPPVPVNAKIANKDTWLPNGGGADGKSSVLVNKGDVVLFSSWESHRSPETFGDDALEFHPERWASLGQDKEGFIPFNLGPRACPGRKSTDISYIGEPDTDRYCRTLRLRPGSFLHCPNLPAVRLAIYQRSTAVG